MAARCGWVPASWPRKPRWFIPWGAERRPRQAIRGSAGSRQTPGSCGFGGSGRENGLGRFAVWSWKGQRFSSSPGSVAASGSSDAVTRPAGLHGPHGSEWLHPRVRLVQARSSGGPSRDPPRRPAPGDRSCVRRSGLGSGGRGSRVAVAPAAPHLRGWRWEGPRRRRRAAFQALRFSGTPAWQCRHHRDSTALLRQHDESRETTWAPVERKAQGSIGLAQAATLVVGNGLGHGSRPRGRRSRDWSEPRACKSHGNRNGEGAQTAVTRGGCARGKSSEGYCARGEGGSRQISVLRPASCWPACRSTGPRARLGVDLRHLGVGWKGRDGGKDPRLLRQLRMRPASWMFRRSTA